MEKRKIDVDLTLSLTTFNEELELKVFEALCLEQLKLPHVYLKRAAPFSPNIFVNPMMDVAWQSWRYRALVAIALYNEAHKKDS
ncbi:hypothetical protein [Acinetobacter proteolyticus]|uniref:Uncharacterized protein n=1 Tax=Acinetobacter proteolyticus TaxID=1776741 RepID=A0A2N0WI96_9GAMM|nr:hypothetical protein [Acinetobacter proteolyticus]PKF35535.1 hypothetical protein CW311_04395 [Acinetobacter proteolyticus]